MEIEWINIQDSTPPTYQPLLAYHKKHGTVYCYRFIMYEAEENYPTEYGWEFINCDIPGHNSMHSWYHEPFAASDEDFLYWMPIPEDPC